MVIRPLTAVDFDAVLEAFNEAFSDYLVPLTLTREQLAEMMRRRGWVPDASVGAFEGARMVAFTLNAVEGDRAYDTGTGVIPTHRRRGLGRTMMQHSFDLLRDCTSYTLEVLEGNVRAVELYRSLGFEVTRGLGCWRYEAPRVKGSETQSSSFHPLSLCAIEPLSLWWDVEPSWQNTTASLRRATDNHVVVGNEAGYAIVFPGSGDLPQLAVRRESRRQGIGTELLNQAARVAQKPLRIMNVDDRYEGITAFLERAGATRFVRQLEMVRPLRSAGTV